MPWLAKPLSSFSRISLMPANITSITTKRGGKTAVGKASSALLQSGPTGPGGTTSTPPGRGKARHLNRLASAWPPAAYEPKAPKHGKPAADSPTPAEPATPPTASPGVDPTTGNAGAGGIIEDGAAQENSSGVTEDAGVNVQGPDTGVGDTSNDASVNTSASNGNAGNASASNGNASNASASNGDASNTSASNGDAGNASASNGNSGNANAGAGAANASSGNSGNGNAGNANSGNAGTGAANAANGNPGNGNAGNGNAGNGNAGNGNAGNGNAGNGNTGNGNAGSGNSGNGNPGNTPAAVAPGMSVVTWMPPALARKVNEGLPPGLARQEDSVLPPGLADRLTDDFGLPPGLQQILQRRSVILGREQATLAPQQNPRAALRLQMHRAAARYAAMSVSTQFATTQNEMAINAARSGPAPMQIFFGWLRIK